MKKRKGMMLPLIIIISVFILALGVIVLSVSEAGGAQTGGNFEKLQSYNLAKAGIEMGMAFLYSPSEPGNINSMNWFEKAKSGKDFDQITDDLKKATTLTGSSGSVTEGIEVFLTTDEVSGVREIESAHIYKKSDTSAREGEHFGDIEITISLVDMGGSKKLDECIYRIESNATLAGDKSSRVNAQYSLTMDINVLQEFDRNLR